MWSQIIAIYIKNQKFTISFFYIFCWPLAMCVPKLGSTSLKMPGTQIQSCRRHQILRSQTPEIYSDNLTPHPVPRVLDECTFKNSSG